MSRRVKRFFSEDWFDVRSCVLCGKGIRFWQRRGVWTDYWYDQGNSNSHSYICHKKCVDRQHHKDSKENWDDAIDAAQMLSRIDLFVNTYKDNEADEYLLALLPNAIKKSKDTMAELGKRIDKLEKYQEEAKKNILMKRLAGLDNSDED